MRIAKKGQAEIIGLAILVVILVFILVIALNFSFKTKDTRADLRKSLIANNLLNAIIKEEGKVNVKEIINNCYSEKKRDINNGQNCLKLNTEISKIIKIILGEKDYLMMINAEEIGFFKQGNCERGIESIQYRFKVEGNTFAAKIRLC